MIREILGMNKSEAIKIVTEMRNDSKAGEYVSWCQDRIGTDSYISACLVRMLTIARDVDIQALRKIYAAYDITVDWDHYLISAKDYHSNHGYVPPCLALMNLRDTIQLADNVRFRGLEILLDCLDDNGV